MPLNIVRQDITKLEVDAIVNAANTQLKRGGGVCGAIFKAAGAKQLQAACKPLAPIQTGQAVITPGFELPAKYIIHVAGPVYREHTPEQSETLLRAAYTNSMQLALDNDCESIAFPLISSGIYGYPKPEALQVATSAIRDFLEEHELEVTLAVFDKQAFSISQELLGEVESYIDEHYIRAHRITRPTRYDEADNLAETTGTYDDWDFLAEAQIEATTLDDLVGNLDEPFAETLLRLIDRKGLDDVTVYKRANIDRKLFSKIRSNKDYRPSKRTALALAVALNLSLEETQDLLQRAGYALSQAMIGDVIVAFFIGKGGYDVLEINQYLFYHDQPLLGSN